MAIGNFIHNTGAFGSTGVSPTMNGSFEDSDISAKDKPDEKVKGLSESDISNAAYEGEKAGYEAVSDRVLQMTGLDMKNAEDRAKLCEQYDINTNQEEHGLGGARNSFEQALVAYDSEAMDEPSRGKGDKVAEGESMVSVDRVTAACDATFSKASGNTFASEIYEKSGLDINAKDDREALNGRISDLGYSDSFVFNNSNPMLSRAHDNLDYANNHHAVISDDAIEGWKETEKENKAADKDKVLGSMGSVISDTMERDILKPSSAKPVDIKDRPGVSIEEVGTIGADLGRPAFRDRIVQQPGDKPDFLKGVTDELDKIAKGDFSDITKVLADGASSVSEKLESTVAGVTGQAAGADAVKNMSKDMDEPSMS